MTRIEKIGLLLVIFILVALPHVPVGATDDTVWNGLIVLVVGVIMFLFGGDDE